MKAYKIAGAHADWRPLFFGKSKVFPSPRPGVAQLVH